MRDSGGGRVLSGFDAEELAETVSDLLGGRCYPRADASRRPGVRRARALARPVPLPPRGRAPRRRPGLTCASSSRRSRPTRASSTARVGAELERRGHESAHVSVSREAARLLRERGLEARCLLDCRMDEPADLEAEVRRIEATYPIPHIREVYYADRVNAGKPEEWAIRRTVRHFRALERLVDELRPDVLVPEVGNETIRVVAHLIGLQRADPGALPPLHDLPEPAPALRGHAARADRRAGGAARAVARGARGGRGVPALVHRAGDADPRVPALAGRAAARGALRSTTSGASAARTPTTSTSSRGACSGRTSPRPSGRGRRGRSTTTSRACGRSSTSRSTSPTTTRSGR